MVIQRHLRFFLVALVLWSAYAVRAADWPQFRGPGGQGIATGAMPPVTWDDNQNLLWKTELPGWGVSSPILLGDHIYLTCYSGYGMGDEAAVMEDLRLHLLSVARDTGAIVWTSTVKPALPESKKVRDHGYTAQTPVTDGEHLYVFFGRSGLFKFDLAGKQLWQADVGSKTHGWGSGTSPVLHKNLVIVNASVESGSLFAIDKESGKQVWRTGGMQASWNTPHLLDLGNDKNELVVSVKDWILAFDPATGEQLWKCEGIHDYVCPSIVSRDDVIYAIGGRKSQTVAVKAGGRGDVTATHRLWVADVGANVSSPVVHDDHLYWISDRSKKAYCVALNDGSVKFEESVPAYPYASTVLIGDRLYTTMRRGGTVVWGAEPAFKILARNEFSDNTNFDASPAVVDGRIYLRSNQALYCVGAKE